MRRHYHYMTILVIGFMQPMLVRGFSTGAGACPGGFAAVSGLHRSATEVSERTLLGSFTVMAGETELQPGKTVNLPAGETLTLTVQSKSEPFKGILVRLEAPAGVDTDSVIASGSNTKEASVCIAPVVGLTHNINSVKMRASGVLRFDSPVEGVHLDITIVQENSAETSAFFYSRYTVNFRSASNGGGAGLLPADVLPSARPPVLRPPQSQHSRKPKGGKKKGQKDSKKKRKGRKGGMQSKHSSDRRVPVRSAHQSTVINALSLFRIRNGN